MKNEIKIVTDNGCDLDLDFISNNDIYVIKFGLIIDDMEFEGETGKEVTTKEFYEKLANGAMPKTNQINPYVAKKHLESVLKEGYDVLYISFSSGLSGSYNSVNVAALELKEKYPNQNIYVLDSLCASLGQGLFLDYIVKEKQKGTSFEDLVKFAEDLKLKIHHEVAVDDLYHLKRGGRVKASAAFFGTLLGIKPILHLDKTGALVAIQKVRGRLASIKNIFEKFKNFNEVNDEDPIFISHADCYEDAIKLSNMIKQVKPNNEIYINYIGPIIGSHAGQGTLALFYKGKERTE